MHVRHDVGTKIQAPRDHTGQALALIYFEDERAHWQARGARLRIRLKARDSGGGSVFPIFCAPTY